MSENTEIQKKYYDDRGQQISRKLMKKLRRVKRRPHKPEGHHERNTELCGVCSNPIVSEYINMIWFNYVLWFKHIQLRPMFLYVFIFSPSLFRVWSANLNFAENAVEINAI